MCFSPEASFTVSAALALVGYACMKKGARTPFRYLALVPWFFAIQQAAEGVLWLYIEDAHYPNAISLTAEYIYLFFALVLYPVWFSIALIPLEKDGFRKNLMFISLGLGIFVSAYNIYYILLPDESTARVVDSSIQYYQGTWLGKIGYAIPIYLAIFSSSVKGMWIFGLLTLIIYGICLYFYFVTFTSIWCFFAAIVSLLSYFVLRVNLPKTNDHRTI